MTPSFPLIAPVRALAPFVLGLGLIAGCSVDDLRSRVSSANSELRADTVASNDRYASKPATDAVMSSGRKKCEDKAARPLGPHWNAYSDGGLGSMSHVTGLFTRDAEPDCAAVWTGRVGRASEHTFSAIGTHLGRSLDGAQKVVFDVRGSGAKVRAQFPLRRQVEGTKTGDSKFYDYHGAEFLCGGGDQDWRRVELSMDAISQRGWGHKIRFDPGQVTQVELVTVERPLTQFTCEIRRITVE